MDRLFLGIFAFLARNHAGRRLSAFVVMLLIVTLVGAGLTLAQGNTQRKLRIGDTVIGDGCEIGPNVRLTDCRVAADCAVQHAVGADAEVGAGASVGPFAHLPPGSSVAAGVATGAFYTAPVA